MSLPIPDCSFTLSLILFNISLGLLCSDPAQPISATEGADKSVPPVMDRTASSSAEPVADVCPVQQLLPAPTAWLDRPQPHRGACTQRCSAVGQGLCYLHPGSCPQGKSDKHTISFDTNSVYKILLLWDHLAYSHQDATSCNTMELLFSSSPQLLPVSVP